MKTQADAEKEECKRLGKTIQYYRRRKGLKIREFAEFLDVSQTTVHDWEHGNVWPKAKRFAEIAEKLDIDPADLLTAVDKKLLKKYDVK